MIKTRTESLLLTLLINRGMIGMLFVPCEILWCVSVSAVTCGQYNIVLVNF